MLLDVMADFTVNHYCSGVKGVGGVLENFCKISILLYTIYRALYRIFGGSLDFWWLIHELSKVTVDCDKLYLTQMQAAWAHIFYYTL